MIDGMVNAVARVCACQTELSAIKDCGLCATYEVGVIC